MNSEDFEDYNDEEEDIRDLEEGQDRLISLNKVPSYSNNEGSDESRNRKDRSAKQREVEKDKNIYDDDHEMAEREQEEIKESPDEDLETSVKSSPLEHQESYQQFIMPNKYPAKEESSASGIGFKRKGRKAKENKKKIPEKTRGAFSEGQPVKKRGRIGSFRFKSKKIRSYCRG